MTTALGGMLGSAAVMGLGSLLPVQSSLLASTSLMGLRLHPDKARKSSAPIAINAIAADAGAAEACALVSGMATSPPRTVSSLGTRRVLAPSYCLHKTRRRRQPSNGGDGREADDNLGGGGGGNDGNNWGGGGGGGDADGWEEDARRGGALFDALCLWQALCLFSALQVLHYIATTAMPRDKARGVSALASLYNGRRVSLAL